ELPEVGVARVVVDPNRVAYPGGAGLGPRLAPITGESPAHGVAAPNKVERVLRVAGAEGLIARADVDINPEHGQNQGGQRLEEGIGCPLDAAALLPITRRLDGNYLAEVAGT